jgi:hypothetical protein
MGVAFMDRLVINARRDKFGRLVVTLRTLRKAPRAAGLRVQALSNLLRRGTTVYQHEAGGRN